MFAGTGSFGETTALSRVAVPTGAVTNTVRYNWTVVLAAMLGLLSVQVMTAATSVPLPTTAQFQADPSTLE